MKKNKTGLKKTLIEYIENISFSEENVFNDEKNLVCFINCIFRVGLDNLEQDLPEATAYNHYIILKDMFKGADTRLPVLRAREKKECELLKFMKSNKMADYDNCANDVLSFNLSDEFYAEYSELGTSEKCLIGQMLLSHGLKMFAEYIKFNKGRETTMCLVLHVDEENFHVHRLYWQTP